MWTELVAELNGKKLTMVDHDRDTAHGDEFARRHGIVGQPAMVIYGAQGKLLHRGYGPSTRGKPRISSGKWAESSP
ncbi:MAG: hypothetical protein ABIQ47_12600 [Tepidiformaceae bacterium]